MHPQGLFSASSVPPPLRYCDKVSAEPAAGATQIFTTRDLALKTMREVDHGLEAILICQCKETESTGRF